MKLDLSFWKSVRAEDLFHSIGHDENREFVLGVLDRLTPDPVWTMHIINAVRSKKVETRCVVSWLARELQPDTYLEVGVRRGFSMAMVAARRPMIDIYGFDMWVHNYAGTANPGPEFVQSELSRIGYKKNVKFKNGSSHSTLPTFLKSTKSIDLITIDGDHSLLGAYQDLIDLMPHCAVGGVVVFDDIAPDVSSIDPKALARERGDDPNGWRDLLGVWHAIQKKFSNFLYFQYLSDPPGVGIGVRLS